MDFLEHIGFFHPYGALYGVLIGAFEILAVLVFVAVIVFWIRRNIIKLKRFWKREMTSWPKNDANYILYFEMVLMTLVFSHECYRCSFSSHEFR